MPDRESHKEEELEEGEFAEYFGFPDSQCGLCGWVDLQTYQGENTHAFPDDPYHDHHCRIYSELEEQASQTGSPVEWLAKNRHKANRAVPPYESPFKQCKCDFSNMTTRQIAALQHWVKGEHCSTCYRSRVTILCTQCGKVFREEWPDTHRHRRDIAEQVIDG